MSKNNDKFYVQFSHRSATCYMSTQKGAQRWKVESSGRHGVLLGTGATKDEAWTNAAAYVRAENKSKDRCLGQR